MRWPLYISALLVLAGCTVNYSFTGGKVPDGAETVQIDYFRVSSSAPLASGLSSQAFTEALRDVYLSQTKLAMVQEGGDLRFEGEIVTYNIAPINISASSETAAQNRLTMAVDVNYYIRKHALTAAKPTKDSLVFNRQFRRFVDYDSNQDFSGIEEDLLTEVNDQLTQDIFNASLGDW